MTLTPEQRDKIGVHITPKLAEQGCQGCGQHNEDRWLPVDEIGYLQGVNMPIVILTCQICGNLVFFNAWQTQVVPLTGLA
jgi:hypothetical protein